MCYVILVKEGDRIAQLIIEKIEMPEVEDVDVSVLSLEIGCISGLTALSIGP